MDEWRTWGPDTWRTWSPQQRQDEVSPSSKVPGRDITPWLAEYARRRTYAWQKLNSIPGITCVNSRGAFYLFPNISGTGLKSADFCARLLEQEKVAAVPGIAFGADDYIRLSYATGMANIRDVIPFPRTPGSADF